MSKKEFIIRYSPSWCHVELKNNDAGTEMYDVYLSAIKQCPTSKHGDIVPYNNSFWWVGCAENAADFIRKFLDKLNHRRTMRHA